MPDTFTKLLDEVVLDTDERMTKAMKEVYCYLRRFSDQNLTTFPSVENICQHTMNSDSTVRRATRALVAIGLIEKQRRYNDSNVYIVFPYSNKVPVSETVVPVSQTGGEVIQTGPDQSERPTNRLEDTDYLSRLSNRLNNNTDENNNWGEIIEYSSTSEALAYARSQGSTVSPTDFGRQFGSEMRYYEPELNIFLHRVIER